VLLKRSFWILSAALSPIVVGCSDDEGGTTGPDPGPFDLTFTGTIAPHAGQMLRVLVIRDSNGAIEDNRMTTVAGDGTFSFTFADNLLGGESYTIDFYADHNGNGQCDSPPTDHSWRETIPAVSGDVTIDFQHNTDFTDVCDSFMFDLTFTATVAPHAGQMFHVAVVGSGSTLQVDSATVAGDGTIAFTWPRILEDGEDYKLDFYADHNGNGSCDTPPADHAWRRSTSIIRGPTAVDFQHDTNFTDVCSSFP